MRLHVRTIRTCLNQAHTCKVNRPFHHAPPPPEQIFSTPLFKLDDALHQEFVSCVVYRLIGQALQADQAAGGALTRALGDRFTPAGRRAAPSLAAAAAPTTPGGFSAFFPTSTTHHPGQTLDPANPPAGVDHTGSVIGLLAAVFAVHPQLWLAVDQPFAAEAKPFIEHYITRTAQSDAMKSAPEVRVPFLELLTSMSNGEMRYWELYWSS